jgi:ABC-type nitrate/sulfonate/bicarbonate transport system ATPase subunit
LKHLYLILLRKRQLENGDKVMDIKLSNITKEFNDGTNRHKVLDNLSLDVKSGDFVSIIGPSGAGKTTLLKVIAGFYGDTKPTKEIFMIFQDFNQLFPWRTLGENILYAILKTNKGIAKSDAAIKAHSVLADVSLDEFYNYYPHQLSGGMKQRGALARALAVDSKVLLMDEPFSSLDVENKKIAYELLLKIWEKNKLTIIFVTHDIVEARLLSDKVLYFEDLNHKISV